MSVILLVRHAAYDDIGGFLAGRSPGVGLGATGRAQAARLAARLRRERLDMVEASPRERTQETARAIADASGLAEPRTVDALDEIDFGRWSGQEFARLDADPLFRAWNEARATARTPAGESMSDVQTRIVRHMEVLTRAPNAACIALVSHADVIKAAVCYVLGLPLDAYRLFDVDPASITKVRAGPTGMRLAGLNEVVW